MPKETYPPSPLCATCGGACCKTLPGCVFPQECGDDVEAGLRAKLASGKYIFDYWEGEFVHDNGTDRLPADKIGYYLRPKVTDEVKSRGIVNGAWGGVCVFHTDTGCTLSDDEERPLNCRALKPKATEDGRCSNDGCGKQDAIAAWIPHNELIEQIIAEHREALYGRD
jgi:hypothetical protein